MSRSTVHTYACTYIVQYYKNRATAVIQHLYHLTLSLIRPSYEVRTAKPVYNNHSRDQVIVVSVDRWSLYNVLVSKRWTIKQPTVVTIDRWTLRQA